MTVSATPQACILVLGMHRSGTSALTRVLSYLGAGLPKDIMPPAVNNNETGFWEPSVLVEYNDRVLAAADRSWHDYRSIDAAQMASNPANVDELAELIRAQYADQPVFVLKDPRVCRLVPLYRKACEKLGIETRALIALRHPFAVAASLNRRDGFDHNRVFLLLLLHLLEAERTTRDIPRAVVSYEAMLYDWRGAILPACEALRIDCLNGNIAAASEIDAFLSSEHQHFGATRDELLLDPAVSMWLKRAYIALLDLADEDRATSARATLDALSGEIEAAQKLFTPIIESERLQLQGKHEATLAARTNEIASLSENLAGRNRAVAQLQAEIALRDERLSQATSQFSTADTERQQLLAANAKLSEQKAEAEIRLGAEKVRLQSELAMREAELKKSNIEKAALLESLRDAGEENQKNERIAHEYRALQSELLSENALRKAAEQSRDITGKRLHSIERTRLGRVITTLEAARTKLHRYDISLLPVSDLQSTPAGEGLTHWEMTGADPQFEFDLGGRILPIGHYALTITSPGRIDSMYLPKLYIDSGKGYSEAETQIVAFRPYGRRRWMATISLMNGAVRLRFDPSIKPGSITLGALRLRRRGKWEHHVRLATSLVRQRVRKPGDVLRVVAKAGSSLASGGPKLLAANLRTAASLSNATISDYEAWVSAFDTLTDSDLALMREQSKSFAHRPLISIVMPTYNTPLRLLREAIESVMAQTYDNWELCIADDASTKPNIRKMLKDYEKQHQRVRVAYRNINGHISHASNSALEIATGEWIALLDHDDLLAPHALFSVVDAINKNPNAGLFYSDEDKIDDKGKRFSPHFKCSFSPELFRSMNYFNHLTVHRADLVKDVGGFREGLEGSQDYDLALRIIEKLDHSAVVHIPMILYHWRAVAGSTALNRTEKNYAYLAGFRALEDHMKRTRQSARVIEIPDLRYYRICYEIAEPAPMVSLIIPTKDRIDLLQVAVESIIKKTTYNNYEIIVMNNNSEKQETFAYFNKIQKLYNARIIDYPHPFNFSAINNAAVRHASGQIVGLVNNDIEVIDPDWLTEMVRWAQLGRIGCVGSKLHYPDGRIQHAGVIIGVGGVAGHSHKGFGQTDNGYFARLSVVQNLSAVTAACLLVRKSVFDEVGGLDEAELKVAFNDVDFCLKVQAAGYLNVFTPFSRLYHHESPSRGHEDTPEKQARFAQEVQVMMARWNGRLENDPFYSPNLTLDREDFSYAFPPRVKKPWQRQDELTEK